MTLSAKAVDEGDLFEVDAARSLLDQLLTDSRLYRQSSDYRALLDFVVKLRNIAPFNAMLLQIQKPGLTHVASARDWRERFGREVKKEARPLVILWPFGPVAFVYDVLDTDGEPLPTDAAAFFARGTIDEFAISEFVRLLQKKGILCRWFDAGDGKAGAVQRKGGHPGERSAYEISLNRNHSTNVQFSTLAHELGHLFLGHLGADKSLKIPERLCGHVQEELEAESVAYVVCSRNGVGCRSHAYLANYVSAHTTVDDGLDIYQVLRAAGQVETILGLSGHTKFDPPPGKARSTAGPELPK